MPAWEQAPSRPGRIRQAAALLAKTATVMAAAIRLLPAAARLLPAAARALAAPVVPGGRARPWAPETGGAAAARRPAADRIWPGGADHL